jgi:hypothetical protein
VLYNSNRSQLSADMVKATSASSSPTVT